ncbi:MAG: hypothetical protein LBS29_00725, partial [Endomicrobium sp.]|nr:hypothetical protein [Endomicrobium sp.]
NNSVQFTNAKNVSFGLLLGFDSFSFALPNDIQNSDTILFLRNQFLPVIINAQKLSISNYDSHSSPLTVNLIHSFGIGGKLGLTNTNGSYLFTNTRTELIRL